MNSPSPVHFHSGDLSGVLYLKVTEIANEPAEEMKPKVGDFYIFPGWLLHGAEPFGGKGERRSLAFNAFVTGGF
jgi:hypothetical protein